jgi:hypothetical protein
MLPNPVNRTDQDEAQLNADEPKRFKKGNIVVVSNRTNFSLGAESRGKFDYLPIQKRRKGV